MVFISQGINILLLSNDSFCIDSAIYNYAMAPWQWSLQQWIAQIESKGAKLYFWFEWMYFLAFCQGIVLFSQGMDK